MHALKTLYTRKVKMPTDMNDNNNINKNINIGKDSFLYELNLEKLREHEAIALRDK